MNSWKTILAVALLGGLVGFVIVYYSTDLSKRGEGSTTQQAGPRPAASPTASNSGNELLEMLGIEGTGSSSETEDENVWRRIPVVIFNLSLAALLAAALAFRPRKTVTVLRRNPYVSQTQILLSVVASALMMVVGDNAARAFGIFAAVSLVRFRTNIRDPKEVTVLLLSLAIGLATGVGRWELAIVLCLFVLPLLYILELYEPYQVTRTMEVRVKTEDIEASKELLKSIFTKHKFISELREITPPDGKEPLGSVLFNVGLGLRFNTDQLSEEIMAADPKVHGIEWAEKKNSTSVYQ
jgi:uncharacterized membrane protein YhiD involved in acid resistance